MPKTKKCDIIIPVYNAPEWVKLCIYSLFLNTDNNLIGTVYLINDCSDDLTINCLNNLQEKYKKLKILNNETNLGFIKSVNKGMHLAQENYVLLLNTDCIITKGTIEKLINHVKKNNKIGLICPISSNAANISLDIFDGFNFAQMNKLLESKFLGKSFDACTVVGNCLLITKKCIDSIGYLDEAYGMGYGDETDYQFKAMSKGFEAKVAIDTYVFHKSEVSFGISKEKKQCLEVNRNLFFSRWGNDYYKLMEKYKENDPIKYIMDNLTDSDKKVSHNFVIYLIGIVQNAGGVHIPIDIINYLAINNIDCNILYNVFDKVHYKEIMLFNPIQVNEICNYHVSTIVSTLYLSTYYAKYISDKYNIPLVYFAQGYEAYFENGTNYGMVELSYKLPDSILTISKYLKNQYKTNFNVQSDMIPNGVNYDLLKKTNTNNSIKNILFCLRGNTLKGDYISLDIIKKISNKYSNLHINVIYNDKYLMPPFNCGDCHINYIKGPLSRKEIIKLMQNSDIYFDTSISEGFGLMPLEAMLCGSIPIVSNSMGVNEYLVNGVNGFIINEINDSDAFVRALDKILIDKEQYKIIKSKLLLDVQKFDEDMIVTKYIKYFNQIFTKKKCDLDECEKKLYDEVLDNKFKTVNKVSSKGIIYKFCRMIPKKVRIFIKKEIEKIYNFTNVR